MIFTVLRLIFLFIIIFSPLYANELSPLKKWNRLENLIVEEVQILKEMGGLSFLEEYRMLELLSERLKILKKKENFILLKKGTFDNEIIKKKQLDIYKSIKFFAKKIFKKNPPKQIKARVYYVLALNSRDFRKGKLLIPYLKRSLGLVKKDTNLYNNIHVQLAEYYYNQKKYRKARNHYKVIISSKKDSWFTKHLLNSAWCDFKLRKIETALKKSKKVLMMNLKGHYYDNNSAALDAMIIFSSHGEKVEETLQFIKAHKKIHQFDSYLRFGKFTSSQGLFHETNRIILFLEQNKGEIFEKSNYALGKFLFFKAFFFDKFSKNKRFYLTLKKINDGIYEYLDEKNRLILLKKMKGKARDLQKKIYSNKTKNKKYALNRFKIVISLIINLSPSLKEEFTFYLGEVYYFLGDFKRAIESYKISIRTSIKNKIKNNHGEHVLKKSILSLLKIYVKKNIKNKKRGMLWAMGNYIKNFPKGKHTPSFYEKSFFLYLELNQIIQAEKTITDYKKNCKNSDSLSDLLKAFIAITIKKGDVERLNKWILNVEKREYKLPPAFMDRAIQSLGDLLFIKFEKLIDQKKIKEAEKGYLSILNSERYPNKIKIEAHLRISRLYSDTGSYIKSYLQLEKAIDISTKKDLKNNFPNFYLLIRKQFFVLGEKEYFLLSDKIWKKLCSQRITLKKEFFNDYFNFSLYGPDNKKVIRSIDLYKVCFDKKIGKNIIEKTLDFYLVKNDFKSFYYFINQGLDVSIPKKYYGLIITFYFHEKKEGYLSKYKKNILRDLLQRDSKLYGKEKEKIAKLDFMIKKVKEMRINITLINQESLISDLKTIKEIEKIGIALLNDDNTYLKTETNRYLVRSYEILLGKINSIMSSKKNNKLLGRVRKKILVKKKNALNIDEKENVFFKTKNMDILSYPLKTMVNTMDL